MKLSTLRRAHPKALPGITAVARVDRRTRGLAKRAHAGEIAVVDHMDMDRESAAALVEAGVVAVVNAAPSISGRYPNLGPRLLLASGVVLVDDVGDQLFAAVPDGALLRLDGSNVFVGETLIGSGTRQDPKSVAAAMVASRDGIPSRLEALSANVVERLRVERHLLLDGVGVPALTTPITGRQVVVVVRAFDFRRDLATLKSYLREHSPVLIGVDGGADALLAAGHRPDVVLCAGDDVSETALRCGAEVIVTAGRDGRVSQGERINRLGVRHRVFETSTPGADAALLLAHVNDASLIVTVGWPAGLEEFLDTGRSSMASAFLTRAAVGSRVADAKAVAQLYRRRLQAWVVLLAVLVALVAVAAAIATTPVGQDWVDDVRRWLSDGYDWIRGAGS